MLQIEGKEAVVFGGGVIATRKVEKLVKAGARVTVIAPTLTERLMQLVNHGEIHWEKRKFLKDDVKSAFIVIAATNDREVNAQIYDAAKNKLINVVDRPELCTFHVPATVERGHLTIAISTDGISPTVAKEIKKELYSLYDESYVHYLRFLKKVRENVLQQLKDEKTRKIILQKVGQRSFYHEKNWNDSFQNILKMLRDGEKNNE